MRCTSGHSGVHGGERVTWPPHLRLDVGTTVKFFIDGTERTSGGITTNLPTAALRPVRLLESTDATPDTRQADYLSLRAKR